MTTSSTDFQPSQPQEAMLGGTSQGMDSKAGPKRKESKLDSAENRKLLRQFEEWYEVERIRQAPNRYQQAIDDDFYDNLQWSDEDAQELALRGQAPLVYNHVQPAVKWLTGTEKRTRIDWKILPRKDGGVNEAENLTKLMKYVQDVNKSAYTRSRAFEDEVKVGVGWLECGIRGDPTMELLYDRAESWRNVIYDSQSIEFDLSDARYLYRQKWTDLDIAEMLFPDRAAQLKAASVYNDYADAQDNEEWYLGQVLQERAADGSILNRRTFVDTSSSLFNRRARVKLIEVWYRRPTNIKYMHHEQGDEYSHLHNAEYDANDGTHAEALTRGGISLYQRLGMKMWCAIYIRGTLLQNMVSPYKHNDFPFTPVWGNRRGRDHAPYGMIRLIRDPQEDFNKRMSKALHALSTRRIIMEKGAVDDLDDLREEAARPDAIIETNRGYKLEMVTDTDVAEHQLEYANLDAKAIQDNSGITDELMGRKTNAISGRAIQARQDQGSTVTTDYFDNNRLGVQLHGQKCVSLVGQYYTAEKQIRVLGSKRPQDFITLNQMQPDGTILNDIANIQADFIVDETDYRATQRQAMFEQLLEMVQEIGKFNPQWAMMMLDNVLEFSDVPGKDEIIATIRQISGKPDPDKKLSPQEEQQLQAKQAQQQAVQEEMQQLQLQGAQGKVGELFAKIDELKARAAKLNADAGAGQGTDGGMQDSVVYQLQKEIIELERQLQVAAVKLQDRTVTAKIGAGASIAVAQINAAAKGAAIAQQGAVEAAQAADDFEREQLATAGAQAHEAAQSDKKLGFQAASETAARAHETRQADTATAADLQNSQAEREHAAQQAEADRGQEATESAAQREHDAAQGESELEAKQTEGTASRQHEARQNQYDRSQVAAQSAADRQQAGAEGEANRQHKEKVVKIGASAKAGMTKPQKGK